MDSSRLSLRNPKIPAGTSSAELMAAIRDAARDSTRCAAARFRSLPVAPFVQSDRRRHRVLPGGLVGNTVGPT